MTATILITLVILCTLVGAGLGATAVAIFAGRQIADLLRGSEHAHRRIAELEDAADPVSRAEMRDIRDALESRFASNDPLGGPQDVAPRPGALHPLSPTSPGLERP